jgi:hypothetical protein
MRRVAGYENYFVTKDGRVWSVQSGRYLKGWKQQGYPYVTLLKGGKEFKKRVHRLVLTAYVGPCPEGMECCHNDGDRSNNNLNNLRWDTRKENHQDAIRHGTHTCLQPCKVKGEKHPRSKLTTADVRSIVYLYQTGLFSQRKLAKMFGVIHTCIQSILEKKTWNHIWEN